MRYHGPPFFCCLPPCTVPSAVPTTPRSSTLASSPRASRCAAAAGVAVAIAGLIATASLGAVWSSASPDFGVNGIVDRFGQIEPKVLFCADAYAYGGKRHDCLTKVREVLAACVQG